MNKLLVSILVLNSFNLIAGGVEDTQPHNHFYLQGELGYSAMDMSKNTIPAFSASNDNAALSLRLGYLIPKSNGFSWGAELGGLILGASNFYSVYGEALDITALQAGVDLLAVVKKDLSPRANIFAKGGVAYVSQNYLFENNWNNTSLTLSGGNRWMPELAVGLGYYLTKKLELTGTVNHLFGDSINAESRVSDVASVTTAQIGLRYNFD